MPTSHRLPWLTLAARDPGKSIFSLPICTCVWFLCACLCVCFKSPKDQLWQVFFLLFVLKLHFRKLYNGSDWFGTNTTANRIITLNQRRKKWLWVFCKVVENNIHIPIIIPKFRFFWSRWVHIRTGHMHNFKYIFMWLLWVCVNLLKHMLIWDQNIQFLLENKWERSHLFVIEEETQKHFSCFNSNT